MSPTTTLMRESKDSFQISACCRESRMRLRPCSTLSARTIQCTTKFVLCCRRLHRKKRLMKPVAPVSNTSRNSGGDTGPAGGCRLTTMCTNRRSVSTSPWQCGARFQRVAPPSCRQRLSWPLFLPSWAIGGCSTRPPSGQGALHVHSLHRETTPGPFRFRHRHTSIPYRRSAFGVLPPLWSSAAMKPSPLRILSSCWSSMVMYPPLWSCPARRPEPRRSLHSSQISESGV